MIDTPPEPRPAASVLVLRGAGDTLEVLMGRRAGFHAFMPNALVFPGGAVDPGDAEAPIAADFTDPVLARLHRAAAPSLARALGVAAARELEEEVGLSLGAPPSLAGLAYLCRAVTPPDRNRRFDAFFFAVGAAHVTGTPRASPEIEAPDWYRLDAVLAGELERPTREILTRLPDFLAGLGRDTAPVMRNRTWRDE